MCVANPVCCRAWCNLFDAVVVAVWLLSSPLLFDSLACKEKNMSPLIISGGIKKTNGPLRTDTVENTIKLVLLSMSSLEL